MEDADLTQPAELSRAALSLSGESSAKLQRWLALWERRLAEAEAAGAPCDLKEMVAFLTATKRTLEIARLAADLRRSDSAPGPSLLDALDDDE